MTHMGLGKTALLLVAVAIAATGCSGPMKTLGYASIKRDLAPLEDHIADLQAEKSRLIMTNQSMGDENETLRLRHASITNEVTSRDTRIASLEEELKNKPSGGVDEQLLALRADFERWFKSQGFEKNPKTGALVVRVQFDLGSAEVDSGAKKALAKIAGKLKKVPAAYVICIDGHTDDLPVRQAATKKAHYDLDGLSAHRALAVFRALKAHGVNPRQMRYRGFADRMPMVSGRTPAARRQNRRVEISIVPKAESIVAAR